MYKSDTEFFVEEPLECVLYTIPCSTYVCTYPRNKPVFNCMDRTVHPFGGVSLTLAGLVNYQLRLHTTSWLAILCLLPMLRLARAAKLRQLDSLIVYQCTSAWVRLQSWQDPICHHPLPVWSRRHFLVLAARSHRIWLTTFTPGSCRTFYSYSLFFFFDSMSL